MGNIHTQGGQALKRSNINISIDLNLSEILFALIYEQQDLTKVVFTNGADVTSYVCVRQNYFHDRTTVNIICLKRWMSQCVPHNILCFIFVDRPWSKMLYSLKQFNFLSMNPHDNLTPNPWGWAERPSALRWVEMGWNGLHHWEDVPRSGVRWIQCNPVWASVMGSRGAPD